MGTSNSLPNVRTTSDLTIKVRLKDGGLAIDWTGLTDIKAWIYSDVQKAIAGRCTVSIDQADSTLLLCDYSAFKPQYLGVNRIIVQCKNEGRTKTYDTPALNFVPFSTMDSRETPLSNPDDIEAHIEVQDVSSSILDEVIIAALNATERANEAAAAAEHMVDIHTGPAGADGADGADGKSAYELAVEEGYTGTEEEWLASLEGPVGDTPDITIGTVTTAEPGTPAAATITGTPEAPVLNLTIPKGVAGDTPAFTVGEVTTGQPGTPVVVTITGTAAAPVLNVTIPQGLQGNTGSSVDYPYELVNNLTTNDATKGLSAAQGKVLKDEITQLEHKVDDNATEFDTSDTLVESAVDFSRLALRNYSLNENGNYGTGNTYKHCLVPVSEGQVLKIVANSSNPTRYAWFTANTASVSGGAAPLVTGTTRMNVEANTEKVVTVPATANYLYIYRGVSPYNYTPSLVAFLTEKAELSYVEPTQVNLIDPSKVIGGYIDNNGKAWESDSYIQTDYIPIDAETDYTVLCKTWSNTYYYRYVCFYNSSKTRISGINTTGKTFTSPAGSAFVIVSLYAKDGSDNVIDPKNYGLFKGTSPSFVPYYANTVEIAEVPLEKKGDKAIVTKRDLNGAITSAIENLDGVPPLTVQKATSGITISSAGYSNGCSLDRHYLPQFAYSANHIFNFDNLSFGDASSSTMNDDVAPSHFQNTTLGANHAQPTQIATITGHGKTNADIGTAWVKGSTTFYIVRIVDEDNIEFLSENKGTYNNHNFVALTTGTLTKGAETMTVTAISNSQLWPSVANKSQKILLNGETEVVANGTYKCHFCDIVESYEMVNSADVITNLIARVGSNDDPVYTGNSMLRFENIYRFYPGGQVLVMENVIALQNVPIQDIMFNQMALFGSKNYVKTYVPNSLPISGYDFRTPLNVGWDSSLPTFNFTTQYWKDGNNPPNRVVMIKENTSASNGYGIALGFLPLGVGKDLKSYTNNAFELRNNTGKVYPHGVHSGVVGTTMPAGDAYNAVMYRVPFAPQPSYRIAYYVVPFEDSIFAFVDYSESKSEQLTIDEKWNGKPISVVQSVNCSLLTDVYNHGFRVKANYVSGETCFLVVKIG